MKRLVVERKNHLYVFDYINNHIVVEKDGKQAYRLEMVEGEWVCSCPGSVYHGKCWHRDAATPKLLSQPDINEPWAEWAEEANQMMEDRIDGRRRERPASKSRRASL